MDYLSDIAKLYIDNTERDTGNLGECDYPAVNPCVARGSVGHFACAGELNCSGYYQITHYVDMLLPEGWYWPGPAGSNCSLLDPREILCYWSTIRVVIPAIL
ncbi:hypothetical protein [Amycolatopsis sp. DG1A-15b]|uniref:hypothetical protein n=1 Tax=Amycolatopsis sp. DG1A-15b TaxID=3052846 RepID=UPI00255B527E|nr:hypothetical protein [Amycolatopsis sp. DG1A-15b]WIX89887.1 hypothetical protein QRY02_05410 [Amycolatopsis sp. DG1A-15b]